MATSYLLQTQRSPRSLFSLAMTGLQKRERQPSANMLSLRPSRSPRFFPKSPIPANTVGPRGAGTTRAIQNYVRDVFHGRSLFKEKRARIKRMTRISTDIDLSLDILAIRVPSAWIRGIYESVVNCEIRGFPITEPSCLIQHRL